MANANRSYLETYRCITDPHLRGYLNNTGMRRHLRRSGLIDRRGQAVSEEAFRLRWEKHSERKQHDELIAGEILDRALLMERQLQYEYEKRLELKKKKQVVKQIQSQRPERPRTSARSSSLQSDSRQSHHTADKADSSTANSNQPAPNDGRARSASPRKAKRDGDGRENETSSKRDSRSKSRTRTARRKDGEAGKLPIAEPPSPYSIPLVTPVVRKARGRKIR